MEFMNNLGVKLKEEIANEIHNDFIASNKDESVLTNKTDSGLYFTNKFLKAKKRMQLAN